MFHKSFISANLITDSQRKTGSKKGLQVVLQMGPDQSAGREHRLPRGPKAATDTGQGSAAQFPMSAGGQ